VTGVAASSARCIQHPEQVISVVAPSEWKRATPLSTIQFTGVLLWTVRKSVLTFSDDACVGDVC
jgi:hypothetical protein